MSASEKTVTTTPVQYALRYARLGWAVFPCREGEKRPLTEHGLYSATTDEAMISQAWRDNQRANIGVPCGAQFWVLDIDPRHGGSEALAELEGEFGELPQTLTARTPSGGMHLYFSATPEARNSAGKVGPGIDVRGHGGYVCVEGSMVEGRGYGFMDWDPLDGDPPEILPAPPWLLERAFGKVKLIQRESTDSGGGVVEGRRNDFLSREAGKLRRIGMSGAVMDAALQKINVERCSPPLETREVSSIAESVKRYEPAPDSKQKTQAPPARNVVKWRELADRSPPTFSWLLDHWLSWHPTLLSGRGGVGKSLLAQQLATALAIGRPMWGASSAPVKVLYWACEDDYDEVWRRQDRICSRLGIGFQQLDNLYVDARCGMDNAIFASEFGRPVWTSVYGELQDEINDYGISVLILDNLAQTYGGNENDRHHVTTFLNGIAGMVRERPFCPMVLGHIAKSPTSEYSGSTAWENAARMRWYLGDKLPDQPENEPGDTVTERRFLCKRKTNYSAQDYVEFEFVEGVLDVKQQAEDGSTMAGLRNLRARSVVLSAVRKLAELGVFCGDTKGPNYLPKKILEMGLNQSLTSSELQGGMSTLMLDGDIERKQVGQYSNRTPRFGLVEVQHKT